MSRARPQAAQRSPAGRRRNREKNKSLAGRRGGAAAGTSSSVRRAAQCAGSSRPETILRCTSSATREIRLPIRRGAASIMPRHAHLQRRRVRLQGSLFVFPFGSHSPRAWEHAPPPAPAWGGRPRPPAQPNSALRARPFLLQWTRDGAFIMTMSRSRSSTGIPMLFDLVNRCTAMHVSDATERRRAAQGKEMEITSISPRALRARVPGRESRTHLFPTRDISKNYGSYLKRALLKLLNKKKSAQKGSASRPSTFRPHLHPKVCRDVRSTIGDASTR